MSDMYDFENDFAQTYKETCDCGNVVEVSTQKDECPEYYTTVYVKCTCGKSVAFSLPVNQENSMIKYTAEALETYERPCGCYETRRRNVYDKSGNFPELFDSYDDAEKAAIDLMEEIEFDRIMIWEKNI